MSQTESINGVLERLRKVCAGATPGPWRYDTHNTIFDSRQREMCSIPDHPEGGEYTPEHSVERSAWYDESRLNAEFIAAVRPVLPAALDCVEALEKAKSALSSLSPEDGLCWCASAHESAQKENHSLACEGTKKVFRLVTDALAAFQKAAER